MGTHLSLTGCFATWLTPVLCAVLASTICSITAESSRAVERVREMYQAAQSRFEAARNDTVAAWQFGRAAYELADLLRDNQECAQVAETGIDASRIAVSLATNSAPAHYYLALNLGESARAKKLGALKLLRQMEHELLTAWHLNPELDYGGPDRALGLLYLEAPSWPMSIGNRKKARTHLEAAVERSPDYPENRICLAEAYAKWSEGKNLQAQLKALEELEAKARAQFSGLEWAAAWDDWQDRLYKLRRVQEHLDASSHVTPPASEHVPRGRK